MRPLRLVLSAFGPFLGTEQIDLRGFRYSRVFLIHGPVGSGKTFLLDGLCFALYGRSSGGERERAGMRHLAAEPEQDTAVVLDFEVASENYRIERRLHLEPNGLLGPDEVTLWRLPEFGEPGRRDILASSATGAEALLGRLLGLNGEQFCQVAILPQGQFRRFLLAPAEERRAIVERMFDGQRYEQLSRSVQARDADLQDQVQRAWSEREGLVSRYETTEGDPREQLRRSLHELEALAQECLAHEVRVAEWERRLEATIRFETLERQKEMAERELEELTGEGDTPASDLSRRLREALPRYTRWQSLQAAIQQIESELEEQRLDYERLKRDTNFLEAEVEFARRQEEEKFALRRTQERLDDLLREAEGWLHLESQRELAEQRLAELRASRARLARDVKQGQARCHKLEADLQRLADAELRLVQLRGELAQLESQAQQARQVSHLRQAVDQARHREARLREMRDSHGSELQAAERRWRSHQARQRRDALGLLLPELQSGQACPLCGATEHPLPHRPQRAVTAAEERLEERIQILQERYQHAQQELSQAEERRARLEGKLESWSDGVAEFESEPFLASLRHTVAQTEARLALRPGLRDEWEQLRESLTPRRKALRQMRLHKERLETTLAAAEAQRPDQEQRLSDLFRQVLGLSWPTEEALWRESIAQARSQAQARWEELQAATYATERAGVMAEAFALGLAEVRAAELQCDALSREAEELRHGLLEGFRLDFASWTDLTFALSRHQREVSVDGDSVVDKETLIRAVRRQLEQTQELLTELPAPEMNSEQIRHAGRRERDQLELKIGRRATLTRTVEEQQRDVERYDTVVERIRTLEAQWQLLAPLARAMRGDNAAGVTFSDWVLERCFAGVLQAANRQLETLAPQRFVLLASRGLEVQIFDLQAGVARSATTLSGGESFLASLALALGLGEVLQGSHGAAERLGTLFIDEGFGYLDEQALESAIQCLETLRGEGRTIAVVSHVLELRQRIRSQLVLAGRDEASAGQRVRVVVT